MNNKKEKKMSQSSTIHEMGPALRTVRNPPFSSSSSFAASAASTAPAASAALSPEPGLCDSCHIRVPDSPLVRMLPCTHVLHLDCTVDRVLARSHCPLCTQYFHWVMLAFHEDAPFILNSSTAVFEHAVMRLNRLRLEAAPQNPDWQSDSESSGSQTSDSQAPASQPHYGSQAKA